MPQTIEALSIILYLLPGLIGYAAYNVASERNEISGSNKMLAIIVMTVFSLIFVKTLSLLPIFNEIVFFPDINKKNDYSVSQVFNSFLGSNIALPCIFSFFAGLLIARIDNNGWINKITGRVGGNKITGKNDVWHQVFSNFNGNWCSLKFERGDVLVGWPKYYTSDGIDKGLFLEGATWHRVTAGGAYREETVDGPGVLVVDFEKVQTIEYISPQ